MKLYLCRHGDTAWSPMRRLAGSTDLALTEAGEATARRAGEQLLGVAFDHVWVSPLVRARRTAELAGFTATVVDELREMSFGDYEGKTVDEIRRSVPGWTYLIDGCPGGENADDVGLRCDRFLRDLADGTHLVFAHSVLLRVLTARYLDLPPHLGRHLMLSPGGISILDYDHVEDARAIASWNR